MFELISGMCYTSMLMKTFLLELGSLALMWSILMIEDFVVALHLVNFNIIISFYIVIDNFESKYICKLILWPEKTRVLLLVISLVMEIPLMGHILSCPLMQILIYYIMSLTTTLPAFFNGVFIRLLNPICPTHLLILPLWNTSDSTTTSPYVYRSGVLHYQ